MATQITLDAINAQNKTLAEEAKNIGEEYSSDDRRTFYENINLRGNNAYIFVLFCIYYMLFFGAAFVLYKSVDYSAKMKVALLLLFLLYPFLISMVELKIYNTFMYFKALVTGTIYKKSAA
jgi:hypothetical protein